MRVGYMVAAAAVVAAVPLGLLWLDDAMGRQARDRARAEDLCYCSQQPAGRSRTPGNLLEVERDSVPTPYRGVSR
jgi:hypothetical protein